MSYYAWHNTIAAQKPREYVSLVYREMRFFARSMLLKLIVRLVLGPVWWKALAYLSKDYK